MDVVGPVNPTIWRMLNVKYIITDSPVQFGGLKELNTSSNTHVYENENVLPRVYFVDSVAAKSGIDILNSAKANNFDPRHVAFVEGEKPETSAPDSTAFTTITDYKDEIISISAKASGNNFLFLGDTYLPTGWKAYIDGDQVKIFRTNHGFMGIVVPTGEHKVDFKYAPTSFYISKYTALILSSLVIAGLLFAIFMDQRKKELLTAN